MPVTILPATSADVTTIATIQWDAFNTPVGPYVHMFPTAKPSEWVAERTKTLLKDLDNPKKPFYKAIVDEQIVGFAIWLRPKRDGEEEEGEEEDERVWIEGTDIERTKAFLEDLAKVEKGKTVPHWHLCYIAVSPNGQGKGVGRALVQWGIDQADKDEVGITVEATPVGDPFYRSLGFKECAPKLKGFDGKWVLSIMDRDYVQPASA